MARTPNTTVSDALDLPQVRAYLAQLGVTIGKLFFVRLSYGANPGIR